MTELRKRMIECLQLRGLAERTQEAYTRAVRQLAAHYHKSPDQISEEELRQYFLFIKNVKHYSRNTMTVAICGIRFFYEQTLNRDWAIFGIVRPAPEKKLPVILSLAEVRQILGCIRPTVTTPARTATVPSARMKKPICGWLSNRTCCCQSLTSWSLSLCPMSCEPLPAVTRS